MSFDAFLLVYFPMLGVPSLQRIADADTFQGMLSGDVNPTSAFMTGGLKIDGDMGTAMKLGAILS